MGGHGSGGLRPSAGRRPDYNVVPAGTPPVDVPVPDGLPDEVQAVWRELAPHAKAEHTLTNETAQRFRLLCEAIVLERTMRERIQKDGLVYIAVTIDGAGNERETLKAHPLCGPQRGMMQRIETGLQAFRLAPVGKPILAAPKDKPKSALERLKEQSNLRAV